MVPKTMVSSEVYLLPLNDDGSPQVPGEYIYIAPKTRDPFTVRFTIEGTSSICRDGSLWVNIPEEGYEFRRDKFREFKLKPDFNKTIEISVPIHEAGAYAFYTTYAELPPLSDTLSLRARSVSAGSSKKVTTASTKKTPLYYIDVAPRLALEGRALPLQALSVCTVISKFMGQFPVDWERHLKGISDRGYNMVHFTPLQVRGASNSPYSLYDQLGWDPESFPRGEHDIQRLTRHLEKKWGMLAMTDIVLNHTAHNSAWLQEHPEAGYNLTTAPWLESAYVLDTKLLELGNNLEKLGLPIDLKSVDDLVKIMDAIKHHVIAELRLWEYYAINVDRDADAAVAAWVAGEAKSIPLGPGGIDGLRSSTTEEQAKVLIQHGLQGMDRMGGRFRRCVDPAVAATLLSALLGRYGADEGDDEGDRNEDSADPTAARQKIVQLLDIVNVPFYKEYDVEVADTLQQLFNRIKYVRLDDNGPKLGPINWENPLIETYFTRLPLNKTTEKHRKEDLVLVNNGWVWGGNAMVDHAGPDSRVYLRREVIVWGDCTKLRYGKVPEDSPWLWKHMTQYAKLLAKYFHGFRIDNCHSTPLPVAEHMLDAARRVRPDLYVVAELFTGDEKVDYVFVRRLGISALIREAMQAWSTGELSRLIHKHGGRPIGSFELDEISRADTTNTPANTSSPNSPIPTTPIGNPNPFSSTKETSVADTNGKNNVKNDDKIDAKGATATSAPAEQEQILTREIIRRIKPVPVQALFMDCTHDNEVPHQKRDARDTLPNAALVAMCGTAIGSVMGYDEIYPRLIELVSETREYYSESSNRIVEVGAGRGGIAGVKKLLNQIHTIMGMDGYTETHVHHEDQYITVHRVHPGSRKGYFLVAHTAFPGYGNGNGGAMGLIRLKGTRVRHLGSWRLEVDDSAERVAEALADKKFLVGLPARTEELVGVKVTVEGDETQITVREKFPPGSIALFETWIPAAEHSVGLDNFVTSGAAKAMGGLDYTDLNFLMYKCEPEERDASDGRDGTYDIPGHGKVVYAGLQGWWSLLKVIIEENNLAHPLCQNLREGQWAMDYIVGRLERASKTEQYSKLAKTANWFKDRFDAIRTIPSFLLPRYFGLVLRTAYMAASERAISLMKPNVRNGQWFLQSLAIVSVQQTGLVKSASLYPNRLVPSLAAGLPHFSVEWARCWGRDVFISLRGLYLGTGRYDEAREHIHAFASVLKHGMIPNLLGSGNNPRYNSRDSVWFFLQCIQDYTRLVPDGMEILNDKIKRRFLPWDDTFFGPEDERAYSKESTIAEVIFEVLQRHAEGMKFREANAGSGLDMQMSDEGFNIEIKVDWSNGFVFGGNQANCGTWMDKMGESTRAGSKGVPGTPRDGAAVEITGLLYSSLKWLASLSEGKQIEYSAVKRSDGTTITFTNWAELIKDNFEKCYYVPVDKVDDIMHDINPSCVNRRGIYKDLYRSGKEYEDYQLRPNFPIAMTAAPDLFDQGHAMHALCVADAVLRGPTGMATLDPSDMNYRPYYRNSEDSEDFATSKGRNYHQGPEWLWPTGFFLRALLKFDLMRRAKGDVEGRTEAFQQVTRRLMGCKKMIEESAWAGLTELTQKGGEECGDSSPTQAWSAGCLIDLYMDAEEEQARFDQLQLLETGRGRERDNEQFIPLAERLHA